MNTERELCQELFKLMGGKLYSEWGSTYFYWTPSDDVAGGWTINPGGGTVTKDDIPAYDLGYLLRKLPGLIDPNSCLQINKKSQTYTASYSGTGGLHSREFEAVT